MEQTFTKDNFDKLKLTCQKIISLTEENCDGNLMASQLMCLADRIKEFNENPIVKNSGIKGETQFYTFNSNVVSNEYDFRENK